MPKYLTIFILALVISLITIKTLDRIWTGDEPRHFYYSASFFESCGFTMDEETWRTVLLKTKIPGALGYAPSTVITGRIPGHSVFIAMLLSPVVGYYSLDGARITALLIGLIGVYAIFFLCLSYFTRIQAILATCVGSLTIPALPYFGFIYPEIFLFTTISVVWFLLQNNNLSWKKIILILLLIFSLPFIYVRGSLVAIVFFVMLLYKGVHFFGSPYSLARINSFELHQKGFRLTGPSAKFILLAMGSATLAAGLYFYFNLSIYGHFFGYYGHLSFSSWLNAPLDELYAFFFHFRHGLLTFSPIYSLAFIGLLIGIIKGEKLAIEATTLLFAIIVPIWGYTALASESWPARYMVAGVPMLVIGFGLWLKSQPSCFEKTIAWVLGVITLANTVLFVIYPNMLLVNRTTSVSYPFILNFIRSHLESLLQSKTLFLSAVLLVIGFGVFHRLKWPNFAATQTTSQ